MSERSPVILGLDPGTAGAWARLGPSDVVDLGDLPVHRLGVARKKGLRDELDLHALRDILLQHQLAHVFIEQVNAMPKQGVTSTFRFGFACGALYGAVAALGLPLSYVRPQAWQKHHHVGPEPDAAIRRALQLYPQLAGQLARKRDNHRADALLIALYGQATLAAQRTEAA